MKKTIKINLSGIIFHLDEDAYEKFKIYIDSLNKRFEGIEEGIRERTVKVRAFGSPSNAFISKRGYGLV